jgi:ATP-dependent Clp protease ATP-binding subunit ClpA
MNAQQTTTRRTIGSQTIRDRYTLSARNAIQFARREADIRSSELITVADLLAGLSVEENTRAERIGSLKANASYLRWLSGLPALPMKAAPAEDTHPSLDPDVKRAFTFAVDEADRDREYWIDSDHLLRGLLRFHNKADYALLKTEVSLKSLRDASRRDRASHLPEETPNLKVVRYLVLKQLQNWAPPLISAACYLYILVQSFGFAVEPIFR